MGESLFGIDRPDVVCGARVEVKLPAQRGKPGSIAQGRPLKIWTGQSDADESLIHLAVCENEVLRRLLKDRRLLNADGSCTLAGKLTYFDANQTISKHDIEILYVAIESEEANSKPEKAMQDLFVAYSQALKDVKASHDNSLAKISEGFGQLAQAFSAGLGKISEQTDQITKLTRRLEKDRRKLTTALLSVTSRRPQPQADSGVRNLELALKGLQLLRDSKDDKPGGSSSGSNGNITAN